MNRDQLLGAKPQRISSVDVDGIGQIHYRAMTGRESLALEAALMKIPEKLSAAGMAEVAAQQLAVAICDEAGKAILDVDDARSLLDTWTAKQVRQVIVAFNRANAIDDEAIEEAGKN